MYGKDVGSLSILTKDGTAPETLRRVFNGQQSSNWFLITEQLTLTSSDMVSLKNMSNSKYCNYIAVKNLKNNCFIQDSGVKEKYYISL